ncbi:MAG: MotA/TolQ/ExbB proton channel family protein [Myxococcota bacterium]
MDSTLSLLTQLVERGGPVVVLLLALSVLALAIALLKLGQLARARLWSRAWIGAVVERARRGDAEGAQAALRSRVGPVARVLECAVAGRARTDRDEALLREEIESVAASELTRLGSNLRGLDTIASLAPLLGLLGTVLGMIRAFIRLEQAGSRVDPALLAGGIWEALLTTAVGLTVAIPTLAVLAWLESQVDRTRRHMEDAVTRILTAPATAPSGGEAGGGDAGAPSALRPGVASGGGGARRAP